MSILIHVYLISFFSTWLHTAGLTNLALNKPTRQSSTLSLIINGSSELAVDGNRNPNFQNGSCSHTNLGHPAWWLVYLEEERVVTSVRITNRKENWYRLTNFTVEVSLKNPETLPGFPGRTNAHACVELVDTPIPSAETYNFECSMPSRGRYLRIVKYMEDKNQRSLALCEVEVYGAIASWRMKKIEAVVDPSQILKTLNFGIGASKGISGYMQCARSCLRHTGKLCQLIDFHIPSRECRLVHSFGVGQNVTQSPEWVKYALTDVHGHDDNNNRSSNTNDKNNLNDDDDDE